MQWIVQVVLGKQEKYVKILLLLFMHKDGIVKHGFQQAKSSLHIKGRGDKKCHTIFPNVKNNI